MQEIVDKVLEAEREAEKIVQEARARAAEIRRQADEESERRLQEARVQAQALVRETLAGARAGAAKEQQQARVEAERRNARFLEERADALEAAVEAVVTVLVTPEQDRKDPGKHPRGTVGE